LIKCRHLSTVYYNKRSFERWMIVSSAYFPFIDLKFKFPNAGSPSFIGRVAAYEV
jgi:phage pi2 protein 07